MNVVDITLFVYDVFEETKHSLARMQLQLKKMTGKFNFFSRYISRETLLHSDGFFCVFKRIKNEFAVFL